MKRTKPQPKKQTPKRQKENPVPVDPAAGDPSPPTAVPQRKCQPRRYTAQEALAIIQSLHASDSGEDRSADDISSGSDDDLALSTSSNDDSSDATEEETAGLPETSATAASSAASVESCSMDHGDVKVTSKDGTNWDIVSKTAITGRFQSHNVFTAKCGVTSYARAVHRPVDAFRLIMDEGMFRHIKQCTVEFARRTVSTWDITDDELDTFVGLLYLRGCMNAKNFPLHLLWSEKYGCQAFHKTMSRDRFKKIKQFIRFDSRTTRAEKLKTDKFSMMSWVLERFVENSQKAYVPQESLTVDEQLFPTKARCRFTQYMPNKPDKFGIKFWILAEVSSKYCLNVK